MTHYGNALKQLSTARDFNVILIGCLMLILLEDLRKNPYAALIHIRAGRQLLTNSISTILDRHLCDELQAVFKALYEHQPELAANDIRIGRVHRGDEGPDSPSQSPVAIISKPSSSFESLHHASETLQSIRRICVSPQAFPQPLTRFHVIPGLTEQLNEWLERFNVFTSLLSDHQQIVNNIEIHTLRAFHLILRISSCCTDISTETCYDYYALDLEGLVKKFSIMGNLGSSNLATLIFFVACKYRDVAGRRRAIDLLRDESNGWRGAFLAGIAEIVVRLEEKGNEDAVTHGDIPEYSRVRPSAILTSRQSSGRDVLQLVRAPFGIDAPTVETTLPVTNSVILSHLETDWKNAVCPLSPHLRSCVQQFDSFTPDPGSSDESGLF